MNHSTLTPLYEAVAARRVERYLSEALFNAREALAHCSRLPVRDVGRMYELTKGAVDSIYDALEETEFWA